MVCAPCRCQQDAIATCRLTETDRFFRYKPTGIVQYTFPKPGDEFPEFIDAAAPPLDLPPEEKLVSQQQVKRRGTADSTSVKSPVAKQGDEVTSATLAKGEGGGFWFQPDFMYLGPGSYNDISPVDEKDEEQVGLGFGGRKGSGGQQGSETDADQAGRSHISPEASAGTTPLASNSQTAVATPVLDSVTEVAEVAEVAVELPARRAPVGVVAELPSETTARCHDETHPAPVELPDHGTAQHSSGPVSYSSAFDIAPVELPTDRTRSRATLPDVSEKRSAPPASTNSWHSHQNPTAQAVLQAHRPPSVAAEPAGEKYQPYNPVRYVAPQNDSRRASQPVVPPPNAGSRYGESTSSDARYTMPAQGPSDAPSFLRPPQPPPKRPLDGGPEGNQPPLSFAEHIAATRVPSVLQPARGRPNLPLQTSVASIASASKQYEPYSPYRELQDDIDQAVKLLTSGVGGETGAASHRGSPLQHSASQRQKPSPVESRASSIARTNTLPLHMPSLPFMGGGPSSAAQTTSAPKPSPPPAPIAATNTSSQGAEGASRAKTDLSDYMKYATAAPANSGDLPKPLNLARNSVVYPAYSPPSQPVSTQRRESEDSQYAAARHSFASDLGARPSSTFSVVSDFSTISEATQSPPPQPSQPWQSNMSDVSRQRPAAAHSHSYAPSVSAHRSSVVSLEVPSEQAFYQNPVTPPPEANPQRPSFSPSHASAPSVYRGTALGGPSVGVRRNPSTQSQASVTSTSSRQSHGPGTQRPSSRLSSHSGEAPDNQAQDQSFGHPLPPQNRPHSIAYGQMPVHDPSNFQAVPPNAGYGGPQPPTPQQPPHHYPAAPDSSRLNDCQYRQVHNQSTPVPDAQSSAPRKSSTGQRPVTFAGQPMYFNPDHSGVPSTQQQQNPGYQAGQVPAQGQGQRLHSMAGPPSSGTWPNQNTTPPIQRPGSSHQPVMSFQSWMGPQPGAAVPSAQQAMPEGLSSHTNRPTHPIQLQPGPRPQPTPAHQQFPSGGYNQAVPSGLQAQPAAVRGSSPSPGKERNRLVKQPRNGGGSPLHESSPASQNNGVGSAKLQKGGGSVGSIPQQPSHPTSLGQQRVASVPPPNTQQQSHNARPVSYMAAQPNPALRPAQASAAQRPMSQQLPHQPSFSQRTEQLQSPPPRQGSPQRPLSGLDAQRPGSRQQEPAMTSQQQWGQQQQQQQQPPRIPQNNPVTHAHSPSFGARPPPNQQQPVQQIPQNRPLQGHNLQTAAQSHTSPRREPPSQSDQQQIRTTKTQPSGLHGEGAQSGWGGQGQYGQPRYGQTPPVPLDTSKNPPLPKKAVASPVELPSSPIPVELSSVPTSSSSQEQQRPQGTAERSGRGPPLEQPLRQEPPQRELLRQEAPRQQPPREELPRQEPSRQEPSRQEPLRQEPPRPEPPRQAPQQQEPPRKEAPRQEAPRHESLRQEPPRGPSRREPQRQEQLPREPPQREPPRQVPPLKQPPRQEPPRQEPARQIAATPGPNHGAFGVRNMANENQPGGRRPSSDDPSQRQIQPPDNKPPPPEVQKQAPQLLQQQPAPRPPVQQPPQPSQHQPASRLPARQAPVQTPKQQPANPAPAFSGGKPLNQPTQDNKRFPVDNKDTAVAGKLEPPAPAKLPSPVLDLTPAAPSNAAEKAPGGWGDTSGYDGSGWGDDDDFY